MADRLRCRPGDLTIVTRCSVPERLGPIVKIVGLAGNGEHDWLTELQGDGIPAFDINTQTIRRCTEALTYDWKLTPIRRESVGEHESASRIRPVLGMA